MSLWLIETGIDTKGAGRLATSLREAGAVVTTTDWLEGVVRMPRPPGVFHGSIQSSFTARDLGWHVFGLNNRYQCTHYYPINYCRWCSVQMPRRPHDCVGRRLDAPKNAITNNEEHFKAIEKWLGVSKYHQEPEP